MNISPGTLNKVIELVPRLEKALQRVQDLTDTVKKLRAEVAEVRAQFKASVNSVKADAKDSDKGDSQPLTAPAADSDTDSGTDNSTPQA